MNTCYDNIVISPAISFPSGTHVQLGLSKYFERYGDRTTVCAIRDVIYPGYDIYLQLALF